MNLRTSVYERIFQIKKLDFIQTPKSCLNSFRPGNDTPNCLESLDELKKYPKHWADSGSRFYSEAVNRNILIQKTINDVNLITNGITMNAFFFLRGSVFATGGISMVLYNFPQLLVYTGIYLLFFSLRSNMYNKKLQALSKEQIGSLEKVSSFLGEGLSNGHRLRQAENSAFFQRIFNTTLLGNHEQVLKLATVTGSYFRFLETFGIGLIVGIMTYGSYLISVGGLASEDILLSLYAIYGATGLRSINNAISEFKLKAGVLESLEEFLGSELAQRFNHKEKGELNDFYQKIEDHYISLKNSDENFLRKLNSESLRTNPEYFEIFNEIDEFLKEKKNPISLELRDIIMKSSQVFDQSQEESISETQTSEKHREVLSHRVLKTQAIYALSGKSGSGKTSVMRLILGNKSICEGNVEFFPEKPLKPVSTYYMPQSTNLFSKNILFNILATNLPLLLFLKNSSFSQEKISICLISLVNDCLRKSNLHAKIDFLLLDEETQNLSGGEKQRVSLAGMMFSQADLVLVDEGTASLDHSNVLVVREELKRFMEERLTVVISHDQEFLEFLVPEENRIELPID